MHQTLRLGVLGTSDIALRRFLPALTKIKCYEYIGVASRSLNKISTFQNTFGGNGYVGYDTLIDDPNIDAVYIPLPPALHFKWAKRALLAGKHVLLEKPFTVSIADTLELLHLAKEKNLAVHENYMFVYHSQLQKVKEIITQGKLGKLRLIRSSFGFPFRGKNDFRYDKTLGGGALLDCGGYPIKLAHILLGDTATIVHSQLNYTDDFEVDIYGSAVLRNEDNLIAQISFGMDNSYKCELEIWGSRGYLKAPRIFTASPEFIPELIIELENGDMHKMNLSSDDQFVHSIERFTTCIQNCEIREESYREIAKQSELMMHFYN